MENAPEQIATIEHCMPTQGGNVSLSNLLAVSAILYVAEHHGCKWRGLPKRFGNWRSNRHHVLALCRPGARWRPKAERL
jgi:transposase